MGSITERKRKDGTIGYRAEVVRKRAGNVVLKLTETFDRGKAAQEWIAAKEKALEKPGALDAAIAAKKLRGLGYEGGYDAVRRYAAGWQRERAAATATAFVPLSFAPGEIDVHIADDIDLGPPAPQPARQSVLGRVRKAAGAALQRVRQRHADRVRARADERERVHARERDRENAQERTQEKAREETRQKQRERDYARNRQSERHRIKERISDVKADQHERGAFLGGKQPLGWTVGEDGLLARCRRSRSYGPGSSS